MKQTEHQAKLGVFVFLQHTAEVKLYIGELHQLSGVADDSQDLSVADDAIYILCSVEIFEHSGMSRFLAHTAFGTIVEGTLVQGINASVGTDTFTYDNEWHFTQVVAGIADVVVGASHFYIGSLTVERIA